MGAIKCSKLLYPFPNIPAHNPNTPKHPSYSSSTSVLKNAKTHRLVFPSPFSLCCFASFLTPRNLRGSREVRKTVSAWERETSLCYEVLAPLSPCVAGLDVLSCTTNQISSRRYKEHKFISSLSRPCITLISASLSLPSSCIRSIFVLASLSSSCLSLSLSFCFSCLCRCNLKWWMGGIRTGWCQDSANGRRVNWHLYHLQVIQHVSHVASVVQSVSVCLLRPRHLALVLQYVPQVSPGCRRHVSVSQNKL